MVVMVHKHEVEDQLWIAPQYCKWCNCLPKHLEFHVGTDLADAFWICQNVGDNVDTGHTRQYFQGGLV